MTGRFRVDLDQLAEIVDQIVRFDKHLEEALEQADAKVDRLHTTWSGAAAAEHKAAHEKWKHGAERMRAGLATMRQNADIAHGNYTGAATTNTAMWQQAR
jgi:WXG100 family type VII secretion target